MTSRKLIIRLFASMVYIYYGIYIYIYIYRKSASRFSRGTVLNTLKQSIINIMRKKGRNYSLIKPLKSEAIHETGLSGNVVASFFPLIIFILLCFNVLSTVPRENRLADSLYVYVAIFPYHSARYVVESDTY